MITKKNDKTLRDQWFEEFIAAIITDKLLLETDTANPEKVKQYEMLLRGDDAEIAYASRLLAHKYFVKRVIIDYLILVNEEKLDVKLAFDMDNSEILVWAQIPDDREDIEDRLLMIEAKVNAKYHSIGYDITSTIVENRDGIEKPTHYIILGSKR